MNILSRCVNDIIKYWNACRLQMGPVIVLISLTAIPVWIYRKKKGADISIPLFLYRLFVYICDGVYLTYSFYVTFGMRYIGQRREVKWIPFYGVLESPWEWPLLLENVLLFVPFGILAPLTARRFRSLKAVLLSSGILSILIEVFQYIFQCGKTEVDDCILNCLGALTGYVLYVIGSRLREWLFHKNKESI